MDELNFGTTRTRARRFDPERVKDGPLKELAGRLSRLSYREMLTLSAEVYDRLPDQYADFSAQKLAEALLQWSDKMGATV